MLLQLPTAAYICPRYDAVVHCQCLRRVMQTIARLTAYLLLLRVPMVVTAIKYRR